MLAKELAKSGKRHLIPSLRGRGTRWKYRTPEEMQQVVDRYFHDCALNLAWLEGGEDIEREFRVTEDTYPALSGLALALGMSRAKMLSYRVNDGSVLAEAFASVVAEAKARVEAALEQRLLRGGNVQGVVFALKNSFGWRDKDIVAGSDTIESAAVIERVVVSVPAKRQLGSDNSEGEVKDVEVKDSDG